MRTVVEFETAILAKEKGYNEGGIFYQWSDQKSPKCVLNYENVNEFHYQEKFDAIEKNKRVFTVTMPTQDELKNWILKHHFLYVLPIPTVNCCWTFKIIDVQCDPQNQIERPPYNGVDSNDYNLYEEAMESGLKEALVKINKKK